MSQWSPENLRKTMLEFGYESKAAELRHQQGSAIAGTIIQLRLGKEIPIEETNSRKEQFIAGLTQAIDENFRDFGGVTTEVLEQVIQKAETTDWTDLNSLIELSEFIDSCVE